ncbi:MAG: hypothetical protein AAB592_03970 [Patescibacteria group bacterium]
MLDPQEYIQNGHKTIRNLISHRDLQRAYQACRELLKFDPQNKTTLDLFRDVEEEIMELNLNKVRQDIKNTRHLWDEGKYEELLQVYNRLYAYAPHDEELLELIQRAEEKIGDTKNKERNAFVTQAISVIERVITEKRFGEAIQAARELMEIAPRNETVVRLLKKAKDLLIEQKLKEHERVVDSGNYTQALELYESLLKIDDKNDKIIGLVADARRHLTEKESVERRMNINEGTARIKELFKNAEYEKVMRACDDILNIDSKNFTANLYKQKAKDTIEMENDSAVFNKMKEKLPEIRKAYAENQASFVRI